MPGSMGDTSYILGLHFGHDGAVCVLHDGAITGYVLRERSNRIKHALGITDKEIELALVDAGIDHEAIDFVAITSTQSVELLTGLIDNFSVCLKPHPADETPSTLVSALGISRDRIEPLQRYSVQPALTSQHEDFATVLFQSVFPEGESTDWDDMATVGWLDNYATKRDWSPDAGMEALGARPARTDDAMRHGFHLPVTVEWRGRCIPGCFVQHHMAHGAASYYRSGFSKAGVLTHDGFLFGNSYHSGLNFYGDGHRLWPISPNHLTLGMTYNFAAEMVGLGLIHGAGKLMGLAPYGEPVFFDTSFVGNETDIRARFQTDLWTAWSNHCLAEGKKRDYNMAALGDPDRVTEPINADIAASTQTLFEETYLTAVRSLARSLTFGKFDTVNLCLSGGTALNCPSNSRVWRESPFEKVFIEPTCDDSGLAIGAALHVYHNLLENPLPAMTAHTTPYLGVAYDDDTVLAALNLAQGIRWSQPDDAAKAAADDLLADRIVAWFEGRSEAGPRALGHRSILADVRPSENWSRVNKIKGRELWRPFAPIVLAEKANDWFRGCPLPSPYMLFTAEVKVGNLPAITHVDGSSRIQTVDESSGGIRRILEAFDQKTGVPVLMNTSFNGPGEPIVETPTEAIDFLLGSNIDVVYVEGRRVVRA